MDAEEVIRMVGVIVVLENNESVIGRYELYRPSKRAYYLNRW